MPIFEYECLSCRKKFEWLMRHAGERIECPQCGSPDVRKLFSVFSSVSKGKASGSASGGSSCSGCTRGSCAGCGG